MFKQIHIKNFLSCQDIVLDNLESLTVLVGRNGSGKTNILKAIQWAANCATSMQPIEYTKYLSTQISLFVVLDDNYFRYQLEITFIQQMDDDFQTALHEKLDRQSQPGEWQNLLTRQKDMIRIFGHENEIQTDAAIPSLPVVTALMPQKSITKHIAALINFLKTVHYYPLDELNQPNTEIGSDGYVRHIDYIQWLNQHNNRFEPNTSVIMRLLRMFLAKPASYEELKTLLGANGLDIIEEIHIVLLKNEGHDKVNQLYLLEFFPSSNRGTSTSQYFNYQALSFGTRRLLRILVSILCDKSAVLLLEQPEDGIHAGLLHKIIPLLKSYAQQRQFILASHSSEILNRLTPQEVRLVTMANGITHLRPLTQSEKNAAEQFTHEQGTLSEFLETIQDG